MRTANNFGSELTVKEYIMLGLKNLSKGLLERNFDIVRNVIRKISPSKNVKILLWVCFYGNFRGWNDL